MPFSEFYKTIICRINLLEVKLFNLPNGLSKKK